MSGYFHRKKCEMAVGTVWQLFVALVLHLIIVQTSNADRISFTTPRLLSAEQVELITLYHEDFNENNSSSTEVNQTNINISCGLSNSPKIVGGLEAAINEFPWMAYILIKIDNSTFLCGGSLISDRHVVTAGHCMLNAQPQGIAVFLGGHNITDPGETGAIRVKASGYQIHPQYNLSQDYSNDIAIITLKYPMTFTSKIHPICLPPNGLFYDGMNGTIIGWGRLVSGSDDINNVLMKVDVRIISIEDCQTIYDSLVKITPEMLCAGSAGLGACKGDSGGPLMTSIKGRYFLIGIVSFGDTAICGSEIPSIFTKVDRFLEFIHQSSVNEKINNV